MFYHLYCKLEIMIKHLLFILLVTGTFTASAQTSKQVRERWKADSLGSSYHYTPVDSRPRYIVYYTWSGCFSSENRTDTIRAASIEDARKKWLKKGEGVPVVVSNYEEIDSIKLFHNGMEQGRQTNIP